MIKKLEWDSDFFGREIGRLDLNDRNQFDFSKSHFQSTYVFSQSEVEQLEGSPKAFKDLKITYIKSSEKFAIPESLFFKPEKSEKLKVLFFQSGAFSRFKLDPVFEPKFEALYSRWMEGALNGTFDDLIFSTGSPQDPTSCLTLKKEDGALRIGIIAVDASIRGQGIGTKLLNFASNRAFELGYKSLIVSTQKRNKPAISLYEKQGFKVLKREYIYHIHKDV